MKVPADHCGHPDRPGLLEEITQPVGERDRDLLQCLTDYRGGDCRCALADKTPWMFVRRQRRAGRVVWVAAHLPLTHSATPEECDRHKAMKERIARSALRHGLDVQVEARSPDGRIVTDVLVSGAGGRVGWEAQYSPMKALARLLDDVQADPALAQVGAEGHQAGGAWRRPLSTTGRIRRVRPAPGWRRGAGVPPEPESGVRVEHVLSGSGKRDQSTTR
ncbi:hypothetical protein GCM10010230_56180 [Streptomyces narbonensis]|nr:hypothetical protein GCM10010230_56180 [Streptomyces narbonensis]